MNKYKLVLYVIATLIFLLLCVTAIVTIPPAIIIKGMLVVTICVLAYLIVELIYTVLKGEHHDKEC